jgi:hypothetical protein
VRVDNLYKEKNLLKENELRIKYKINLSSLFVKHRKNAQRLRADNIEGHKLSGTDHTLKMK